VLHLNADDTEFKVVFPNERDRDNAVPESGVLRIPTRFNEQIRNEEDEKVKRWLYFDGSHLENESFYLVTASKRLEMFAEVGPLPNDLAPLEVVQVRAVVARLQRHAPRPQVVRVLATTGRDVDDNNDDAITLSTSSFKLLSVARQSGVEPDDE